MIAITQPNLPITLKSEQESKLGLNFEQFLEQCPEDGRYELIEGEIVEMVNTRHHKIVSMSLMLLFNDEIRRLQLSYEVSNEAAIRTMNKKGNKKGNDRARVPDISVIDRDTWRSNLSDYGALKDPIQLTVEVVSANWEDDYIDKLDEYERLGIPEYWIVDYLAIGSRNYLGDPKQPSVLIFTLDKEGKYQCTRFQNSESLISLTFPELKLTVDRIISA